MYTIHADGKVMYAPNLVNEGYGVLSPKLTVELNKAGSLEYILPPNNVIYDNVKKLKTIITAYQDDDEIFRGRVLHDDGDFYRKKKVYCEGELSFLLDSQQRPYTFQGDVPELFRKYVEGHNARVDPEKQFEVGKVTVTDPNNYINRENKNYAKTLDEINEKLIDTHGGYLRVRSSGGKRYLDLVEEYGSINSQVIEFGKNLLDISEYITAEDVFTVLIPLGAEQQDEDGNSIGRLDITSVNDGKDYIEDETAIALFGRIEKTEVWEDVTIASNLFTKGKEHLKNGIEMAVTLTIKAVDLHLLDVNTERIRLGDMVRVVSVPHKLDKYFLCSKIVYDMVNPDKTEFTFGITFSTMTEKQINSVKAAQSTASSAQNSANSAQDSANQANQAVEKVEIVISQMPTDYVKTSTFEDYKKEVDKKISTVYRYKGSVANYVALPTVNREVGDTYNLLDNGTNYAWTDSGWDKLSETIDLSGYAEKEDVPAKVSDLENDSGYMTGTEVAAGYVDKDTYNDLVERVRKLEGGTAE